MIIPFIDRNPERKYSRRKFALAAGVAAVLGTIILGIWGHFS
jgi:quinol-cytochrome oxidoreductase complex cytochrome b subunit